MFATVATAAVLMILSPGLAAAQDEPGVVLDSPLMPPESDPPDCDHLLSAYATPEGPFIFETDMGLLMLIDPVLKCFQDVERSTPLPGVEAMVFTAVFEGTLDFMGAQTPFQLTGPVLALAGPAGPRKDVSTVEITEMVLSGMVGSVPVIVRENPVLSTEGETTVTDLGSGLYHIDSFFDVFVEVSIDGGQTWDGNQEPVMMELYSTSHPLPMDSQKAWSSIKSLYR